MVLPTSGFSRRGVVRMLPQEIITQKREGEALSEDAIAAFC
ncbi:hypothetical protein N8525_02230 [Verrucomicrobiales bacterium]|nr:hypothetical protein [Verrucomicrobiales bacterium]